MWLCDTVYLIHKSQFSMLGSLATTKEAHLDSAVILPSSIYFVVWWNTFSGIWGIWATQLEMYFVFGKVYFFQMF